MPKLVRDKIPEIIVNQGKKPITHTADDSEYWDKLKLKLQEEVDEVLEADSPKEVKEELADILEVINAICDFKNIDKKEVESLREKKAEERGGFKDKIILDDVGT